MYFKVLFIIYNYSKAQQSCLQLPQVLLPYYLIEYVGQTDRKSYQ